ncbi:MAG: HAD family hydrolase [Pseudomonadota bacterium]
MIRALLFDKDGTLTDFRATWEQWLPAQIAALAEASSTEVGAVSDAVGLDWSTGRIRPDGRFVTATNSETSEALAHVTGWAADDLLAWWTPRIMSVPQVAVAGLPELFADLRTRGLPMGVLTNADEAEASDHLARLGLRDVFTRVIGYDSGYGPKPQPFGALAFAEHVGVPPAEVVVVGDGMTDLLAAKRAGMRAAAVLTGTLDAAALAPHAEVVLPTVTALPKWLDTQAA